MKELVAKALLKNNPYDLFSINSLIPFIAVYFFIDFTIHITKLVAASKGIDSSTGLMIVFGLGCLVLLNLCYYLLYIIAGLILIEIKLMPNLPSEFYNNHVRISELNDYSLINNRADIKEMVNSHNKCINRVKSLSRICFILISVLIYHILVNERFNDYLLALNIKGIWLTIISIFVALFIVIRQVVNDPKDGYYRMNSKVIKTLDLNKDTIGAK